MKRQQKKDGKIYRKITKKVSQKDTTVHKLFEPTKKLHNILGKNFILFTTNFSTLEQAML